MTPEQILALAPGAELDHAVHAAVFGGVGKRLAYSSSDAAAFRILDHIPLFVGRVAPDHPQFSAERPWVAGTLAHHAAIKGDITAQRITAASRCVALCRAALFYVHRPVRVARPTPDRVAPTGEASEAAARELAARIGTPAARHPNRVPQPMARVHAHEPRPPMPKRTEKFGGPKA